MENNISLAEIIRRGMKRKRIRPAEVSRRMKAAGLVTICKWYVYMIASGRAIPANDKLLSLCTVLDLDFKVCQKVALKEKLNRKAQKLLSKTV